MTYEYKYKYEYKCRAHTELADLSYSNWPQNGTENTHSHARGMYGFESDIAAWNGVMAGRI